MTPIARYTRTASVLHWLIAALIMTNVALALSDQAFGDAWTRPMIDLHKSIGITVLGLAILRVLWRATHQPPPLPDAMPRAERTGAHAAHWILYGLIFALPLSGWLHDSAWNAAASHPMSLYGVIPWFRIGLVSHLDPATKELLHTRFGQLHTWLGYALYAVFTLHVAGALKHQWFDRQPELQRMLPVRRA